MEISRAQVIRASNSLEVIKKAEGQRGQQGKDKGDKKALFRPKCKIHNKGYRNPMRKYENDESQDGTTSHCEIVKVQGEVHRKGEQSISPMPSCYTKQLL